MITLHALLIFNLVVSFNPRWLYEYRHLDRETVMHLSGHRFPVAIRPK